MAAKYIPLIRMLFDKNTFRATALSNNRVPNRIHDQTECFLSEMWEKTIYDISNSIKLTNIKKIYSIIHFTFFEDTKTKTFENPIVFEEQQIFLFRQTIVSPCIYSSLCSEGLQKTIYEPCKRMNLKCYRTSMRSFVLLYKFPDLSPSVFFCFHILCT